MKSLQFDGLVVSDRDIVDLLESQKHRISKEKIILFLQERGIFCSLEASRIELHQFIASLTIDWFLIEDILSLAASTDENQKVTASNFSIKETKVLDETLEKLKQTLEHKDFIVDKLKNGSYEIQYKTDKLERSNARLIQKTSKDEKISLKVEKGQVSMVSTVGEGTDYVREVFFEELSKNNKQEIENFNIDFSSIVNSDIINNYFKDLIKINPTDFKVSDVIKLKLNRFNSKKEEEIDLEDVDVYDEENDEENPFSNNDGIPNKEDIKSALISGSSLLTSQVFNSFSDKGYFISNITWLVSEKKGEKRKIEYSAGFSDPDSRNTFIYESRGYYEINSATDEYKKNKTKWKSTQKKSIEFKFQEIAFKKFVAVIEKLKSGDSDG
ncbi:TPA: hypothetical protein PVK60_001553 [Acinetobacter baumannii]|uniref:hypothetical protein n=1 Tax=Acinetobacter baumannii TaxID=470 RepID=UPI000BF45482|nr:hypothetical protein [Acinetobacter baumannii]MDR9625207.1 hypothetical protein [Acinetobacter baumannii]HDI1577783.1 hypothetical protein [Acinetobacter baumannii]HDK8958505.1 hypothetical protein [Acinetobacter baumannii]